MLDRNIDAEVEVDKENPNDIVDDKSCFCVYFVAEDLEQHDQSIV